jgi:hypothetical protein
MYESKFTTISKYVTGEPRKLKWKRARKSKTEDKLLEPKNAPIEVASTNPTTVAQLHDVPFEVRNVVQPVEQVTFVL